MCSGRIYVSSTFPQRHVWTVAKNLVPCDEGHVPSLITSVVVFTFFLKPPLPDNLPISRSWASGCSAGSCCFSSLHCRLPTEERRVSAAPRAHGDFLPALSLRRLCLPSAMATPSPRRLARRRQSSAATRAVVRAAGEGPSALQGPHPRRGLRLAARRSSSSAGADSALSRKLSTLTVGSDVSPFFLLTSRN